MSTAKTGQILIVEDNDQMSALLADILELFDYRTRQAKDGEEALRCLKEDQYDLVITDLRMPKMSGTELLRLIKEAHPKLPVVVVSGYAPGNTQNVIITERADGFLNKPFTVEQIERLLKDVLRHPSQ
jgi:DNA-binding NtrC family response regulator